MPDVIASFDVFFDYSNFKRKVK
ncbi:hypothetical protein CHELA1G2_13874 [Hyphomicrobiales bacterium]|nr:hypothetical protein CHELA1G2_13874 [Hyphomicrobiales bacterium]